MVDRRGKFHEERKLNVETFGQASVDQSRFRNFRGRGRGRGGYYRGNRNRNNNYGGYRVSFFLCMQTLDTHD
jgi:protein LSM14